MPLRKANSIDAISKAVEGADIAFSSEAPLTLALDNRVQSPRLGRMAATPRSYAIDELFPRDIRSVFFEVIDSTSLRWKTALMAINRCTDCWTATGDRTAILEYPEFNTSAMKTIVELLGEVESSYRAVAELSLPPEQDIAVIDEALMSALDKSILPSEANYTTVSSLGSEEIQFPALDIFPTATAIVDTIADQIDPESADQFGVVLEANSHYSALLESTLEARGIPVSGGPGFTDNPDIRAFLRLLEVTFGGSDQRVEEIEPILSAAGFSLPGGLDTHRVDSLSAEQLGAYGTFKESIQSGTFDDVLTRFEGVTGTDLSALRQEVQRLQIADEHVTIERIRELEYYLDSVTVPTDTEGSDGVLLTGASSTAIVDRPVVFYVGLGPGWANTPPQYPWIDKDEFLTQDLKRFERLLQNGTQRHYFVQESHAGSDVTPCVYLRRLVDEPFETFSDLPHTRYDGPPEETIKTPFNGGDTIAESPRTADTISQSTLKRLANCPRDQYFNQLVDGPETVAMVRGNLLHEAAEIYCADAAVITDDRQRVLDAMCEIIAPYLDSAKRPVERTKFEIGLDAITRYLEANSPAEQTSETESDRDNELAAQLDVPYESGYTERWFESSSVGLHGFIDLLLDQTTLVDYKTGSKSTPKNLIDAAAIEPVDEYPNFQALSYLAHQRTERPNERLRIHFVHLLHELDAAVSGSPPPVEDLITTVTYVPQTFSEFVSSRETFDELTDYADSNDRVKTLDAIGYDRFQKFFESHALPPAGEAPEQRQQVIEDFKSMATSTVGSYAYVTNGCELIFSDLEKPPAGYVLESDLDAFEAFVDDQLDALASYRADRFPVAFRDDGPTWDRVTYRDLILTDR